MEAEDIYSELVMEHSQHSPHNHETKNATHTEHAHNPNCGDDITLNLIIKDNKIVDASFLGSGCAISQSSTSIMIETLLGKTTEEAKKIIQIFIDMIDRKKISKEDLRQLKNARAFENIKNMPARVKCALLAWKAMQDVLTNLK